MPISKEKYTADEYYEITQNTEGLTELIEGQIVNMSSPSIEHQRISTKITTKLDNYISLHGGRCEVFSAPTDVKLNDDTIVIPDIFVACNPDNFDRQKYNGAPDFVIEITSSNRADDFTRKLQLYHDSGVREYWIVDTKNEKTLVYFFEESNFPSIYRFDQPIPVGIYKHNPMGLEINISQLI